MQERLVSILLKLINSESNVIYQRRTKDIVINLLKYIQSVNKLPRKILRFQTQRSFEPNVSWTQMHLDVDNKYNCLKVD